MLTAVPYQWSKRLRKLGQVSSLQMGISTLPEALSWAKMPLSVYREVAAHLRQVSGVEIELLMQTAPDFDYELSQVGGLRIHGAPMVGSEDEARTLEILNYYRDRFGDWQVL
jgi:hypothetical protein